MEGIVYEQFSNVKIIPICELKTHVDPKDSVLYMLQLMFDTIKKRIEDEYEIDKDHDLKIGMSIAFSEPER